MFWPTDEALNALPAERKRWLSSPDHQDQLAAILKAHIIRNGKVGGGRRNRLEEKEPIYNDFVSVVVVFPATMKRRLKDISILLKLTITSMIHLFPKNGETKQNRLLSVNVR